jgi:hypothetical protein
MPRVSVVMSVLNGERFLREAVESILDQSFQEFEFIIINDGSTDHTGEILDGYQRTDPRVRVYHQENRGLVESLNRASFLAQGKYIARMDADDVAVKDRLIWQVNFLERHPEVAVVGGAFESIDMIGKASGTCFFPTRDREIKSALNDECVLVHPTVLMRKDAFVSAGAYRKVVVDAEDYDLWLRMADHFQMANLGVVVLKRRHHPYQVSVRKCRQQALSFLAAQAAASTRKSGKPDPLSSLEEITPAVLVQLGVSEAIQQANLCRLYLGRIRSMYDAGEYSSALNLTTEILRSPSWTCAEKWVIADVHLTVGRLYWRQRRVWRGILNTGYAGIRRPMILGRPIKAMFRWLWQFAARAPKTPSYQ